MTTQLSTFAPVSLKPAHGGARKGAGRHPVADKADHPVFFRLDSEQLAKAERDAARAGFETVSAFAKKLLLEAIG